MLSAPLAAGQPQTDVAQRVLMSYPRVCTTRLAPALPTAAIREPQVRRRHMSMKKKAITPQRSICTGPYSPGIAVGDWVFVSGQGPLDPQTGQVVGDTIEEQTRRTIQNIQAILEEAGGTPADCVKVAVPLPDTNDYDR